MAEMANLEENPWEVGSYCFIKYGNVFSINEGRKLLIIAVMIFNSHYAKKQSKITVNWIANSPNVSLEEGGLGPVLENSKTKNVLVVQSQLGNENFIKVILYIKHCSFNFCDDI